MFVEVLKSPRRGYITNVKMALAPKLGPWPSASYMQVLLKTLNKWQMNNKGIQL